jgi:hypothetical protein
MFEEFCEMKWNDSQKPRKYVFGFEPKTTLYRRHLLLTQKWLNHWLPNQHVYQYLLQKLSFTPKRHLLEQSGKGFSYEYRKKLNLKSARECVCNGEVFVSEKNGERPS